jgi:hypothetical protein
MFSFLFVVAAGVTSYLAGNFLVNKSRTVRRLVGPL